MLHLRLITPADRTDDVVRLIEGTVGCTHLVVVPGAARNPAGDVVMCDVAREAAFEDARRRATALAAMAGLQLGAVQSIVEGDPSTSG